MNKTNNYEFTIIVPIYNEVENINRLTATLAKYLTSALCSTCVLFVNDGSTDGSLEKIEATCRTTKDFFFISLEKNSGLSAALKAGIDSTESRLVGYIDADLQTSPEDFNLLLPYINEFELVTGIRANRKDTRFKRLQSKIANGFRRMMTGDDAVDTGCPLKIMRTENARRVPFFTGMHRFLPALFMLQNARFKQIPVQHFPRMAGVSKCHLWNRLVSPFVDCFAYRWMKSRYINYRISASDINEAER